MATNENCNHIQKVIFSAVRNRIEKSGFDKFCGMCALDPNAQKGSAGVLWLCLSCGSQLCDQDMKLHALLHHGVPRADVHALAMNTDTFAVRCYCCNVPVEPCVDTPLLEIVEYCLGKAFQTRGSIKPPARSSFRMRGICADTTNTNPYLQCLARTPFLLTMLKERVTSKNSVDIPGGALKFFDEQEIQLPTIENFPLRSSSRFEIFYHVMNELISDDNRYVSGASFRDFLGTASPQGVYNFILCLNDVDDSDRSELQQLIARTFYGTRPSEEQLRKRECIKEFYCEQLRCSSTAYCHTKVFRGTFVTKRYCSQHTRAEIEYFYCWECCDYKHKTLQSCVKDLVPRSHKYECSECQKTNELTCMEYSVSLVLEPPPVLWVQMEFVKEFPFVLDITQYCAPNVLLEQKRILYALYGVTFVSRGKFAAYVKVRQPIGTDDVRWKFLSQHSKDDLQIIANRAADLMSSPLCTENNEEIAQKPAEHDASEQEDPEMQPPPGKWYYVLDTEVREVPDEQVLKVQPITLFYERIA